MIMPITEDDTFRRLKRVSYSEMLEIRQKWLDDRYDYGTFESLLEDNGWTRHEFDLMYWKK